MQDRFKFRDIPPGFADRFDDGTYAVGRGADPRAPSDDGAADTVRRAVKKKGKVRTTKERRRKLPTRTAAE